MEEYRVLRGKIEGKEKYCRIPVRKRRMPILAEEFADMAEIQYRNNLTLDDIKERAQKYWERGKYECAGRWFTYLDFLQMVEIEVVCEQGEEKRK